MGHKEPTVNCRVALTRSIHSTHPARFCGLRVLDRKPVINDENIKISYSLTRISCLRAWIVSIRSHQSYLDLSALRRAENFSKSRRKESRKRKRLRNYQRVNEYLSRRYRSTGEIIITRRSKLIRHLSRVYRPEETTHRFVFLSRHRYRFVSRQENFINALFRPRVI
jgi:hypothetical protein